MVARETGYRSRLARSLLTRFANVVSIEGRYRALLHHVLSPADAILFEGKPNEPRLSECVDFLRWIQPQTAVVLLASRIDIHDAVKILETGADDVAFRPLNFVEFPHRVAGHVRRRLLPASPSSAFDALELLTTCRERLLSTVAPLEPDALDRQLERFEERTSGESAVRAQVCRKLWELDRLFRIDRSSVELPEGPEPALLQRMETCAEWEAFEGLLSEYLTALSPTMQAPYPERSGTRQRSPSPPPRHRANRSGGDDLADRA